MLRGMQSSWPKHSAPSRFCPSASPPPMVTLGRRSRLHVDSRLGSPSLRAAMSSLRYFLESKAVRCNPWAQVHVHDREHLALCLALHEALANTIERYENQAASHTCRRPFGSTSGQLHVTLRSEAVTEEGASLLPSAAAVMPSPPPRHRHFHAAPPPPPRGITTPTPTPKPTMTPTLTPTMTPTLTPTLMPTPTSPDARHAAPSPSRCIAASGHAAPSPAFHTAPMPPPPPRRHRHVSGDFHATTLTPPPIAPQSRRNHAAITPQSPPIAPTTTTTPETRTMAESDSALPPLASQSARALAAALAAEGHVASRRGDAAAAARLLDEAYATAAGAYIALHVETIYERARYAQSSRDDDAAMALAMALATELSSYLLSAANMHLEAGDWTEARTHYTQLLRHGPTPDGRFTMEAAIKCKCEEKLQALDELQRDPASSMSFVNELDKFQRDPEGGSAMKKLISIPELKAQELWQSRSNQEARAPLVGGSGGAPMVGDGAAAALVRSAESIEASALLLVRSAEAEAAALLRSAEAERERILSTVESEVRLLTRSILIEEMHARFVSLDDEAASEQREMEREIASAEAEQREIEREIARAEAAEAEVRAARAMAEAQAAEARAVQTAQLVLKAKAEAAAEVETAKATTAAKAKAVAQAIELEAAKVVAQALAQAIEEHAVAQAIELEAAVAKRMTEADELVSAARAEATAVLAAAEERAAAAKQAVKADELVWAARAEAAAVLVAAEERAAALASALAPSTPSCPSDETNRLRRGLKSHTSGESRPSDEESNRLLTRSILIGESRPSDEESNRLRRMASQRVLPANLKGQLACLCSPRRPVCVPFPTGTTRELERPTSVASWAASWAANSARRRIRDSWAALWAANSARRRIRDSWAASWAANSARRRIRDTSAWQLRHHLSQLAPHRWAHNSSLHRSSRAQSSRGRGAGWWLSQ